MGLDIALKVAMRDTDVLLRLDKVFARAIDAQIVARHGGDGPVRCAGLGWGRRNLDDAAASDFIQLAWISDIQIVGATIDPVDYQVFLIPEFLHKPLAKHAAHDG